MNNSFEKSVLDHELGEGSFGVAFGVEFVNGDVFFLPEVGNFLPNWVEFFCVLGFERFSEYLG